MNPIESFKVWRFKKRVGPCLGAVLLGAGVDKSGVSALLQSAAIQGVRHSWTPEKAALVIVGQLLGDAIDRHMPPDRKSIALAQFYEHCASNIQGFANQQWGRAFVEGTVPEGLDPFVRTYIFVLWMVTSWTLSKAVEVVDRNDLLIEVEYGLAGHDRVSRDEHKIEARQEAARKIAAHRALGPDL